MSDPIQVLELKLKRTQEENEYAKEHALMLEQQLNQIASEAEEAKKEVSAKEQLIEFLNDKIAQLTEKNAGEVQKLKDKLSLAVKENETIKEQTLQYSQEVAKAHEETVKYYTDALGQQQAQFNAEIEKMKSSSMEGGALTNSGSSAESLQIQQMHQEILSLQEQLEHAMKQQQLQRDLIDSTPKATSNANEALSEARRKITEHQEHISSLEQFSQELQAQNAQLRDMITSQHEESAKSYDAIAAQLKESEERSIALQAEVARFEKEALEAKQSKNSVEEEHHASFASTQALQQDLERLRQENATLSASLANAQVKHSEQEIAFGSLKASYEEMLAKERERENSEIDRMFDDKSEGSSEEVAKLKEQAVALEQFSQELQAQNAQLRDMITSQHQEMSHFVEVLQDEKSALEVRLAAASDVSEKQLTALEAANKMIEELQHTAAQASATAAASAVDAAQAEINLDAIRLEVTREVTAALENEKKKLEHALAEKTAALEESRVKADENSALVLEMKQTIDELQSRVRAATSNLQLAEQENALLKQTVNGASQEVEEKIRDLTLQQSNVEQEKESLRATIATLKTEVEASRALSDMLLTQLLPIVELPAGVGGDNRKQMDSAGAVKAAVQFIVKQRDQLTELKQSLQQWSTTYDQARQVNESLNAQFKQVWDQHASAKEELAVSKMAVSNLESELLRLKSNEASLHQELSNCQSRVQELEAMLSTEKGSMTGQAEQMLSLKNDLEQYRILVAEKDDEVAEVRREHESLVKVLEQFQTSKNRDVEEATQYLIFEIEQLKTEIRSLHSQKEEQQDRHEAAARELKKELGIKNVAITALQHKLNDLRRALEESMSKLNDDQSIDKRVVSHLLVNYIHAVLSKRGDEEDIVKVMSGLLNWDSDMMQRAGLIPGPQNPHTKYGGQNSDGLHSTSTVIAASAAAAVASNKAKGFLGGVVKSIWGDPVSRVAAATGATSDDHTKKGNPTGANASTVTNPPKTIAEMWVDFLLTKSDEAAASTSADNVIPAEKAVVETVDQPVYTSQSVAAMFAQQNAVPETQPSQLTSAEYGGQYSVGAGAVMGVQQASSANYGNYYIPSNLASQQQQAMGAYPQGSSSNQMPIGSSPYHGQVPYGQGGREDSYPH